MQWDNSVMFMLLHWYCHLGLGCGKMKKFTLKIFNIFGDVYTRDGTIPLCPRDAIAQIVMSHKVQYTSFGSIPLTPSLFTKWHDHHRYLSVHHVPYLMNLNSPRHCSKTWSKQWWCWWFETPSCPLWCHCNGHCCFGTGQALSFTRTNDGPVQWHIYASLSIN